MNKRILMIDWCEQILEPYKILLEKEGYEVFAAIDPAEGLRLINQCNQEGKPIRVVLYNPQASSEKLFFVNTGIPSCIMHDNPDLRKAAADQFGYCRFLQKPFGRKEISETVAEALREANSFWN